MYSMSRAFPNVDNSAQFGTQRRGAMDPANHKEVQEAIEKEVREQEAREQEAREQEAREQEEYEQELRDLVRAKAIEDGERYARQQELEESARQQYKIAEERRAGLVRQPTGPTGPIDLSKFAPGESHRLNRGGGRRTRRKSRKNKKSRRR